MEFVPLSRMWERVEISKQNNDDAVFSSLMYLGEMLMKLVVVGLVSALEDNHDRYRYRQHHRLVRADGLGSWASVIDELLTGVLSTQLLERAPKERQELVTRRKSGAWQSDSVHALYSCLETLEIDAGELQDRPPASIWFRLFALLRNRTRGHGALTSSLCAAACPQLEHSLRLLSDNYSLFKKPWAVLKRNLSGKYRVTSLTNSEDTFAHLRHDPTHDYPDGVYLFMNGMHKVDLLFTDSEAQDFFLPNGAFSPTGFQVISYLSGDTRISDSSPYMLPADDLPRSETQGKQALEIIGNCMSNLPSAQEDYIERSHLEKELRQVLLDTRHPMITLIGRGGIGKTWLALQVLNEITKRERFGTVLWFSARDIDLLPHGPKLVRPHVLNEIDIAREYMRLVEFRDDNPKSKEATLKLAEELQSPSEEPTLFIFDNFETVGNPVELYTWLDTYVRSPNKILITTRFRGFKGDYPVEVGGMSQKECGGLIDSVAERLGITGRITKRYRSELVKESDGHPYVIKILLGEVAKTRLTERPARVLAGKDDILEALFDRTFVNLSPVARRIFLILCGWHSNVPELALEAALLRKEDERIDVGPAIEELSRSSIVEIHHSPIDDQAFVSVPLAASTFGQRKLKVSPVKSAIQADLEIIRAFGAAQHTDVQRGLGPRVNKLFTHVARTIDSDEETLETHRPMLEFISRSYPPAWLRLTDLYEGFGKYEEAKSYLRRYLEQNPEGRRDAWQRLSDLSAGTKDWMGQAHALLEMCELSDASLQITSSAANTINRLLFAGSLVLDSDEKRIVVERMTRLLEERTDDEIATANDMSRLAWLYLHLGRADEALDCTNMGLSIDPRNEHCLNLILKLTP
jgi:NB-ARC domain/Tetratricopeptide repeat